MPNKTYTMLCLGDSYTIGEAVSEAERFPNQTVEILKEKGIHFEQPHMIARTGWTTDELIKAIEEEKLTGTFDVVTLLIGVNNQYREYDKETYRKEFNELLNIALNYADEKNEHVCVVSIPDWGVTPFGAADTKGRSPEQIGAEIDTYNAINRQEALQRNIHYIDITPISRLAITDTALTAEDNLHPSGKMYAVWAQLLAAEITTVMHY